MRLMWKENTGELRVLEVSYASYMEDLPESYGSGMTLTDINGDEWAIPEMDQHTCDTVISQLFRDGRYDMTGYSGKYDVVFIDDNDEDY